MSSWVRLGESYYPNPRLYAYPGAEHKKSWNYDELTNAFWSNYIPYPKVVLTRYDTLTGSVAQAVIHFKDGTQIEKQLTMGTKREMNAFLKDYASKYTPQEVVRNLVGPDRGILSNYRL